MKDISPQKDEAAVEAVARALFRAHDETVRTGREPSHDFDVMAQSEYGRPVIEGWHAAARAAIKLGARSPGMHPGDRLFELMHVLAQLGNAEKMVASWSNQPREERRRRLDAVMRLSIELVRVRETTEFSTRMAELAIEAVIEGDWKMVDEWAEHFTFATEGEDLRQKYEPIFAIFRELLLQALRAEKGTPA
jgi:hypothetical protein